MSGAFPAPVARPGYPLARSRFLRPLVTSLALPLVTGLLAAQDAVEVRVLRAGEPAANVKVVLQVGLAHFVLAEDFDRWSSLLKVEGQTDAEGRARFAELPASSRVTVFARDEGMAGIAEGSPGGEVVLTLQRTGALSGKVTSKQSLRGYSVQAVGPRGFEARKTELGSGGEWELADVAAGEVDLELRLGNWVALRKTLEVKPGKPTKVPALKLGEEFLTGADPLVDARKVKLMGKDKKPLAGMMFVWSSPWMDGGIPADEEGEVLLDGGGVQIGPPPFILRLGFVGGGFGQEPRYLGEFLGIQRGSAIVEASAALDPLTVTVARGAARVDSFQLFAVSGGDEPRVWQGKLEDGALRLLVPPGTLRLVAGTADGRVTEETFRKEPGPVEHSLVLAVD